MKDAGSILYEDVGVIPPETSKLTGLDVLPFPVVVFINDIVSEYDPAASELAVELIDTVTDVLAPDASVPPLDVIPTHDLLFVTVQLSDELPVFVIV